MLISYSLKKVTYSRSWENERALNKPAFEFVCHNLFLRIGCIQHVIKSSPCNCKAMCAFSFVQIANYCTSWRQWPVRVHLSHSPFYCSQTLPLYQTDLPIIYAMHLRSAYIYKWDVGPCTHWLQRDRGRTDWGGGGHQKGAGGGDYLWMAKEDRLAFLGSDVYSLGVWLSTSTGASNWFGSTQSKDSGRKWVSS